MDSLVVLMEAVAQNSSRSPTQSPSSHPEHQSAVRRTSFVTHDELGLPNTTGMEQYSRTDSEPPASGGITTAPMESTSAQEDAHYLPPDLIVPPPRLPVGLVPDIGHLSPPVQSDSTFEAVVDDPPCVGLPASSTDTQERPIVDPIATSPTSSTVPPASPSLIPLPPSPPLPPKVSDIPPPPQPPPPPHPPPPIAQALPPPPSPLAVAPPPTAPPPVSRGLPRTNSFVSWNDQFSSFPSANAGYHAHPLADKASPRGNIQHYEIDEEILLDEASVYSETRKRLGTLSDSDYMSFDDPIIHENARHFPPRLPTARPFTKDHSRTSARKKIHSWIARYESSQGTRSDHILNRGASSALDHDEDRSSTFSDPSDSSSDIEIEDLWREMKSKRSQVKELKSQMAQKRRELKASRRKKNNADNAFMNFVRPIMVNQASLQHTSKSDLDERMLEMQLFRDEYQDLETSYEELEELLDKEEEELYQIELRFFSLLGTGEYAEDLDVHSRTLDDKKPQCPIDVPVDLLGISSEKTEDLHPHFVDLTLAIASLQNEREELSNLLATKKHCDTEVEIKKKVGQKIPKDIVEFLSDFPIQASMKQEEVAVNEQEVHRLRQVCEQRDLMSKHLSIHMAVALDPGLVFEDLRLDDSAAIIAGGHDMAHAKFANLLSQPDHLLANPEPLLPQTALVQAKELPDDDAEKVAKIHLAEKEHEIHQLIGDIELDGDKADFVNRWLLHGLRTSPLNVALLHSTFVDTQRLQINDPSRWQSDVLQYWWEDDAAGAALHFDEIDRDSQYYSRVGTPPPTRAASETLDASKPHHLHRRAWSGDGETHLTF